ncbi:MAG: hypothetical protein JNJ73_20140 [Hyphomonadaceae bacterium]|nr:hypothetical protein [Hyphomonadaceae bacterium]
MRALVVACLLLVSSGAAFAQTRTQTIIPRVGFRDAIIVRVQQIQPGLRIERSGDLSFTIGPAQAPFALDPYYRQYAAAPGTLGLVIEAAAREAIDAGRRAPAAPPRAAIERAPASQPSRPDVIERAPPPSAPPPQLQAARPQIRQRLPQEPGRAPAPIAADRLEVQASPSRAAPARLVSLLRARAALAQNDEPQPVSRPFLGDLVEVLAIDGTPVSADRLEELSLPIDEAWARARRNTRAGRFAASPLEGYGALVRLTGALAILLDPGTCSAADQGARLFLALGPGAIATADRRTPGAEADFFRLLRDVTQTGRAYSTTPVTCRAGAWEIARRQ